MNENPKSRRSQPALPDLERHERECTVCKHPERAAIEEMFLHWRSPEKIARSFKIGFRCIYRHAHATGLYSRRRRNLRFVLHTFLEAAEEVPVTAMDIINAVRAYAHINDDGGWVEPSTTHRLLVERAGGPPNPAHASIEIGQFTPVAPQLDSSVNRLDNALPAVETPPVSVVLATTRTRGDAG